jgi:hypothetical protein
MAHPSFRLFPTLGFFPRGLQNTNSRLAFLRLRLSELLPDRDQSFFTCYACWLDPAWGEKKALTANPIPKSVIQACKDVLMAA